MRLITYFSTTAFAAAMAINDVPSRVLEERAPAQYPTLAPSVQARPQTLTSQGCFSSKGDLVNPKNYPVIRVSIGFCNDDVCTNSTVFAAKGQECFCGSKYPPKDTQVDQSKCDYSCPSYLQEACGGINGGSFYSVFNTGIEVDVPYLDDPAETSGTASGTAPAETVTEKAAKKANVGGIAAGVVVGALAIAGIGGGVFFYMKKKRNREIEEEHRRNAAVNGFMGHKPGSSGAISITDSRLDPGMVQRRLSDGSIADNQDYSRKILRVTNA